MTPEDLRRSKSLCRLPSSAFQQEEDAGGGQLRRAGSLRLPRSSEAREDDPRGRTIINFLGTSARRENERSTTGRNDGESRNLLNVPDDNAGSNQRQSQRRKLSATSAVSLVVTEPEEASAPSVRPARPTRHSAPATSAPAPEFLARSLLQLGCPVVSMPEPRGGVGSEHHQQPSSDSDDSTTSHHGQHPHHHHHEQQQQQQQQSPSRQQKNSHGQGQGQSQGHSQAQQQVTVDGYGLPKVQVSGPASTSESSYYNGSAGSIGARSAPSTPLQGVAGSNEQKQNPQSQQQSQQQQQVGGSQLTVASTGSGHPAPPPKSPSHAALRCNDGQLSKPLSRSTPSMTAGVGTVTTGNASTRSSPTSTSSSARQKKFHRHFSKVTADERVLNYYSCALVGDILLQGHLYITPNYFAFYSNVFGYVTKLLIPTVSVLKISKEKTARIIPNAVAVATADERHVFCSLLSRDSTFKLMKQVWDAALEARDPVADALPLPVESKLLTPEPSLVDDSELNPEEDDSSMSESGTDLTSRPPTVCTDTDTVPTGIPNLSLASTRLEQLALPKIVQTQPAGARTGGLRSLMTCDLRPGTVIAVLVALLAALYVSAALMMLRIDRLHTAYLNHPLASPERFTQDRLMRYLSSNLDQIVKVRQSLQTLSQQFVTMNRENEADPGLSGGTAEPEESPS